MRDELTEILAERMRLMRGASDQQVDEWAQTTATMLQQTGLLVQRRPLVRGKHAGTRRDPKFRVWDGKRMLYDGDTMSGSAIGVLFIHDTWCLYLANDDTGGSWLSTPGMELEWCTGLKSKNGVDIYEGDILGFRFGIYGPVYWDVRRATWLVGPESDPDELVTVNGSCEVVGDIHENPELVDNMKGVK